MSQLTCRQKEWGIRFGKIKRMYEDGRSVVDIAKGLNLPESCVRSTIRTLGYIKEGENMISDKN